MLGGGQGEYSYPAVLPLPPQRRLQAIVGDHLRSVTVSRRQESWQLSGAIWSLNLYTAPERVELLARRKMLCERLEDG